MTFINENLLPSNGIGSLLANMNSKKLASKYPIWNIKNNVSRETLEEWAHEVNFFLTLKKTFFMSSKFSGVYWVLTQVNNKWILVPTKRVLMPVKDTAERVIEATVHCRLIRGSTKFFWLYEKHVLGEGIYRTVKTTKSDFKGTYEQAYSEGEDSNTSELYLSTGFNILPFVNTKEQETIFFMPNMIETNSDGELIPVSDSAHAKPDIDLLDDAWKNLKYTLRFARPRLIILKDHGAEITSLEGEDYNESEADTYLSGGAIVISSSLALDSENGGVNAFIPNPQVLDSARKEYKEAFLGVLSKAGYAGTDDADSAQKSEYEVAQIRDSEFSSMEDKISLFQMTAKRFIISLGKLLSIEIDKEDGIDIQRLDVREQMNMVDNLIKAVDAGFDDMENAIAKYRGVSKEEARGIKKAIEKEKQKKMEEQQQKVQEEASPEEEKPLGTATARKIEGVDNEKNN